MSNYLFCHSCISSQQRNIKRKVYQQPVTQMLKRKSLIKSSHRLFPCQMDLTWHSENGGHPSRRIIQSMFASYPYARHGLCGRTSNHAKVEAKEAFLRFISQQNDKRIDSKNPTHYLSPRFKTISSPKESVKDRHEKVKTSLVCEFNRTQLKEGKETISDFSVKQKRPKLAIYPHLQKLKKGNTGTSTGHQPSQAKW